METDFNGHILVPTDFAQPALAAFRRACDLARAIQARVSLLHVTGRDSSAAAEASTGLDAFGLLHAVLLPQDGPVSTGPFPPRSLPSTASQPERRLQEWQQLDFADDVSVDVHLRSGRIGEEILSYIRECGVTLTILGVQSRRRWLPWRKQRLAELITREAACSVMLVPAATPSPACSPELLWGA